MGTIACGAWGEGNVKCFHGRHQPLMDAKEELKLYACAAVYGVVAAGLEVAVFYQVEDHRCYVFG